MNPRKIRLSLPGLALCVGLGLAGCEDGFTVYSIIENPDTDAAERVELYGTWVYQDPGADGYMAIRISPSSLRNRLCDIAEVVVSEEPASLDTPPMIEGQLCMTEVAGLTVAELVTPGQPWLYRHYLVRLEPTRISVCGLSLWATFEGTPDAEGAPFSLDGLDYTVRRRGETHDVFVISPEDELRAYLEKNLPRLADLCSKDKAGDEEAPSWWVFERVTPMPADGPDEADEADEADEPDAPGEAGAKEE